MRVGCVAVGLPLLVLAGSAFAAEIRSEYTKLDTSRDCITIGQAEDGDGDWADLVCRGYAHYPVALRYGDARETIAYGFASGFAMVGFNPFNSASDTIEWRIVQDGETVLPFATIHRWFVAPENGEHRDREVLVVSRVGQPADGQGCAVAYLLATGRPGVNERARSIADGRARKFDCTADAPLIDDEVAAMVSQR